MIRFGLALLACSALVAPGALAQPAPPGKPPVPSPAPDGRVTAAYDPQKDVVVLGTVGGMSNITFPQHHTIVRVLFAPDGVWTGVDPKEVGNGALKNNLPIWAEKAGRARMIVHTRDDRAEEKAHQFVLIARRDLAAPADAPAGPAVGVKEVSFGATTGLVGDAPADGPPDTVGVTITDPGRERAERTERARAAMQARRVSWEGQQVMRHQAVAKARLEQDAASGPCDWQAPGPGGNWRYTGWGSTELAPVQICDDGQQTHLRYQGNLRIPAVFTLGADGTEQTAPVAVRGDTLVVQRVAEELHLRLGDAVLHVFNKGFHPVGINPATGRLADPATGTTSPNVVRGLRRASAS